MRKESANILKRKFEASARDDGPLHLLQDLPARVGAEAAVAFLEYYGDRCQLEQSAPPAFRKLEDALAPFASVSAIYHFRLNGDKDFFVVFDLDTALRAAGWSLSGSRELPDPKPETVSAIDRRLAKKLTIRIAETIFENAERSGLEKDSVELLASSDDPSRFEIAEEGQRMVALNLQAQTLEEEQLADITIIVPELKVSAVRTHYQTTQVEALKKWKRDLVHLAATSRVTFRAILTEQDLDIDRLMNLKPGEVINLSAASIDDVTLHSAYRSKSKLRLAGALGNRDGARALKVKTISL